MTVLWSKYFRVCFWWNWNSNKCWPHSAPWTGPHLHSTCQALNKRKWFWRSAKATWLWLGARSMLKLFKNWFTITNTNNMRPEKISNIFFQMFYVCGLAASCLSENYANICDTVSERYVNIFQLCIQHFFTAWKHFTIIHLNHEKYHSLAFCTDIGSVSGTV